LLFAAKLDDPDETASGMAAVSRELSRRMTTAVRGVKVETDFVAELSVRRDAKRGLRRAANCTSP
jgi:hypothetical protein